MHEFHANPMPYFEPHLPAKKTRASTVQQPFNLGTETRGMKKAEEWGHKVCIFDVLYREYMPSVVVYQKYLTSLGELIIMGPHRDNYQFSQGSCIFLAYLSTKCSLSCYDHSLSISVRPSFFLYTL